MEFNTEPKLPEKCVKCNQPAGVKSALILFFDLCRRQNDKECESGCIAACKFCESFIECATFGLRWGVEIVGDTKIVPLLAISFWNGVYAEKEACITKKARKG